MGPKSPSETYFWQRSCEEIDIPIDRLNWTSCPILYWTIYIYFAIGNIAIITVEWFWWSVSFALCGSVLIVLTRFKIVLWSSYLWFVQINWIILADYNDTVFWSYSIDTIICIFCKILFVFFIFNLIFRITRYLFYLTHNILQLSLLLFVSIC